MEITRHFIDVGQRRVHYRCCGRGPALLMVHQSPRSSAEYEPLMRVWGERFTCIAPDSPGFGQSDPLSDPNATIDDFANALTDFLDALGLDRVGGYGFHSGGIILVAALRRWPERFTALAIGGYAVWTPAEMAVFGEHYLPPFVPTAYGEHLTWLWNRILEQSWFFPWFDVSDGARMTVAHDDPARIHATVMDMLAAGDAYRAGYGAVLRASRDIPPSDAVTPPVLITAYDGDPLQAHLDRLGTLPANWRAERVATPAAHQAVSRDFLLQHPAPSPGKLPEAPDEGFVRVATDGFDGLIHWRGDDVDPPGHGLSNDWPGPAPEAWPPWQRVFDAFAAVTGRQVTLPPMATGDPDRLYPDLTPDRFGTHLTRAWSIARAATLFDPWYEVGPATALPVDAASIAPDALARATLARLRAPAARALHKARLSKGED